MDTEVSNYTHYTFKKCVVLGKDNFSSHSARLMYVHVRHASLTAAELLLLTTTHVYIA